MRSIQTPPPFPYTSMLIIPSKSIINRRWYLLVHRWLYDVLLEPRGAVGCDGERRHLMREIPSGQLHVGEERRNAIGVDGRSVVRQQMLGVAPTLVVCLVLPLVLVATVGEFDQQRLLRSRQHLAVEHGDDFIALFPRFHPASPQSIGQSMHAKLFFVFFCVMNKQTGGSGGADPAFFRHSFHFFHFLKIIYIYLGGRKSHTRKTICYF